MLHFFELYSRLWILYLWACSALEISAPLNARDKDGNYVTATVDVTVKKVITFEFDAVGASSTDLTSGIASLSSGSGSATHSPSASSSPSSTLSTGPSASSGYVFNSQSTSNVAVYFGQTAATGETSLAKQCADPNIDIVIIAFLVSRNDSGGPYPRVNFGAACGGQTPLITQKAPGLLSCPDLAADIKTCQTAYGKKVLLSIGGSTASITFDTESDASAFGSVIWDLFGPQGNIDSDLRPFGSVSIDGFDIGR
jgi:hypothetical protein